MARSDSASEDVLLEDMDIFKNYLVLSERYNGLNRIRIMSWDNQEDYYLPFDNETYTAYTGTNPDFDTNILRYGYNSLTTPASVIDFDMKTKESEVKKEQEVQDPNFNKENYLSERIWATAQDGTKIPMSVVYKKGIQRDGSNPVLQYAYKLRSYNRSFFFYFKIKFIRSRIHICDRSHS